MLRSRPAFAVHGGAALHAVEVKSITGKPSTEELAQLADYKKMVRDKISVQIAGKPTRIERAMYEFTEPVGVRANLTAIERDMILEGVFGQSL